MRAMSLSARLNLGAALSLLLVLAVAAASWSIVHEYEHDVAVADRDLRTGLVQLAEAESALWQLRYGFPQFMVGDAELQKRILDEEPKWYAVIDGALAGYGAGRRTPEELATLAELRAAFERYRAARPKFFELWQAGRRQEATDWRALTTTPYGAATVRAFERQIGLMRDAAQREAAHAEGNAARARKLVTAIVGSLIALLALGYVGARRALAPIVALRERTVRSVREALGAELGADGGNEVAALVKSVDAMTRSFAEHAERLARSRDELQGERLTLEQTVASRTEALAQTVARVERQNREILLRNELGDLLHACIGIDEAGAVIARYLPQLFPGASGAVYLHNSGSASLVAMARWGEAPVAESLGLTDCWALRRGKAHRADCGDESMACAHISRPLAGLAICVPLAAHGETLGLLHLACPCECVERDAEASGEETLAEALAAQVGMALANLRLRDSLRELAIRDALTGLHNRRYLEESLERELARAVRENRPLAVFMLDVDFFKRFNDDYGHEAGDEVLRALGQALQENARAGDLVCRFGGEEFTAVLPGAPVEAAREWGERLRARLRRVEVKSGGRALPPVTVSLGLAVHPQHGADRETLLQAADLALYEAKHAGRDRIAVSGEAG